MGAQLNAERFINCAPRLVYVILLDEGIYLYHWRTMYQLLAREQAMRKRRDICHHPLYNTTGTIRQYAKPGLELGHHHILYVVLDISSCAVVGWLVVEREAPQLAEHLIMDTYGHKAISPEQLTLYAD